MILLSALIVIIVFSTIIFIHELGHFLFSKLFGVRVEKFAIGFGKKLIGFTKGDTEYRINLVPLGGYCKISGEDPTDSHGNEYELASKPVGKRFWILAGGSLFNYIFAFVLFVFIYCFGAPVMTSVVGGTLADSPAQEAGLKQGDRILAIDDASIEYWEELVALIKADVNATPLKIKIQRDGQIIIKRITPSVINVKNVFGQEIKYVGLGISPSEEVVMKKTNPFNAVVLGAKHTWFFTATTYKGLWMMITGAMPVKDNVGGPIRIVQMLSRTVKHGWVSVISMMATISLALAIFNLLPFPVLDGGHIVFLGLEKIRKRPLSPKVMDNISNGAWILLLSFVVYVSYFDTKRVIKQMQKKNETVELKTNVEIKK